MQLNLGTAVGPITGGLAALADARFAFAGSTLLFGLLGTAVFRLQVGLPQKLGRQSVLSSLHTVAIDRSLWRLIAIALPWFFLFPQLYVAFPLYAGRLAGPHAASAVYVVNGVIGLTFMLSTKHWLVRINPIGVTMYAYLAAAIAFISVAVLHGVGWFLLFVAGSQSSKQLRCRHSKR